MPSTPADATSVPYHLLFTPDPRRHDDPDDDTGPEPEGHVTDVDPEPKAAPKPTPKPVAKPADPAGDDDLGDAGKRALTQERERRKALAAEVVVERAAREAAEKRITEFEDAQRSELERAQAAAERAADRERAANRRAVTSDIRSFAISADALDPSDVVEALERRSDEFITDSGIDTAAVEKAVADLLEKKPHWRKPEPAAGDPVAVKKPRAVPPPTPDPAQGAKGGTSTPDWSDPATYQAEAAKLGLRNYR